MKKKVLIASILTLCTLLIGCYSFATNNDGMNKAVDSVRNVVGGAENVVENAGKGLSNGVKNGLNTAGEATQNVVNGTKSGLQNAGNMVKNTVEDTGNAITSTTRNTKDNRYNATRTATGAVNTATVWTWLIIAVVALAIIGLVWYYAAQKNNVDSHHNM